MRWTAHIVPAMMLSLLLVADADARPEDALTLQGRGVRVVVRNQAGTWHESYYARREGRWIQVLKAGNPARPEPALNKDGKPQAVGFETARYESDGGKNSIVLTSRADPGSIEKRIALADDPHVVTLRVTYRTAVPTRLRWLLSTYSFVPGGALYALYKPVDFVFTPQLRPEQTQVIADHVFRSPALMMQEGSVFAALLPDPGSIDGAHRVIRSTADLQVNASDRPFFSFGLQNWQPEPYALRNTHVFYTSPDSLARALPDTTVAFGYDLYLNAAAAAERGYQDVVRRLWALQGRKGLAAAGPQGAPFASDIRKAWEQFLPSIALDTVYDGQPVTLLRQGRLAWSNKLPPAADNDCWFNVWFNALRTAYGMHLYGVASGNGRLVARAERVLTLALTAPQKEGLAPTIFYLDSAGGHWVADHAWGGIAHGRFLPMFHNAWTGYWMLEWARLVPLRRNEIMRYTTRLGDFLLAHQGARGVIPSWFDPQTLAPAEELRDDNAETAGAALFLARLHQETGDRRYLSAAERAMQYIFTDVLPERKWFDFETFFSCSRKPLGFYDSVTTQHPQNTLSMHQAAEACRVLYKCTGKHAYLDQGSRILDYLCLYQQVWSPRWLSKPLFGGFGVQNTDGEWSDARQGYFAVTLADYYEMTGRTEYFERGVAALRAMFSLYESPTSPRTAENYAHAGYDTPAGVTGIHWGTGSSVVSVHIFQERYGDALVDATAAWGCGIDGCTIEAVRIHGRSLAFDIRDTVASPRTVKVKFRGLRGSRFTITVNGKPLGSYSAHELTQGISVEV